MLSAHIVKRRRGIVVDVRLEVGRGESVALIGPSGSGKSTLLNCIAGFDRPDSGHVVVEGQTLFAPHLPLRRRSIGYLAQSADLFPHMSVAGNVTFGLKSAAMRDGSWLNELRDRLDLGAIWHAPASRISGGQARRVSMARMLARRPNLVLLDEPFAAADRDVVRTLISMLAYWQETIGFSLLIVDHGLDVLTRVCRRAVAIDCGRVVQSGTWPQLQERPATKTLARLLTPL